MDFVDFIQRLKLTKGEKSNVFMVDFEKTSDWWSGVNGIIMDVGYNVVDFGSAISSEGRAKPAQDFIRDSTAKVVYEVLRNPVFFKEMSELKRMRNEGNKQLYGYYEILLDQGWFSKDVTKGQIQQEFSNFMYFTVEQRGRRIQRDLTKHLGSQDYWASKKTFSDPSSGARRMYDDAVGRYNASKNSLRANIALLNKEMSLTQSAHSGSFKDNQTINKIQENYQIFLLELQKNPDSQENMNLSNKIDYSRTWEEDKLVFNKMGYGGTIEPWDKIMTDMEGFLEKEKENLLAISAFQISSEKSNLSITSSYFGNKDYSNLIDKYYNVCMKNLSERLAVVDPEDVLNLLFSEDQLSVADSIKIINKSKIRKELSLQAHFRDIKQEPDYKQKHTGVQDAFDQSEVFVETARKFIEENLKEFSK